MKLFTISIACFCVFAISACKKYNPQIAPASKDFTLSVADTANITEDGTSYIKVLFTVNTPVKNGLTLTLSSTMGTLQTTSFLLDSLHTASTYLKVAQDTGLYTVTGIVATGTTQNVEETITFRLQAALPDSLNYEASNAIINTKTPLTINTFLSRKKGLVTVGTSVNFKAFQLGPTGDTISVGRFTGLQGNFSDSTGALSPIMFYSDNVGIDTTKTVTIQATTKGTSGNLLVKKMTFTY